MIWRYRLVLIFLFLGFGLILSRLFYWQIVKAEDLREIAQKQYGAVKILLPQRGDILTSDNFPLASEKVSYLVFANPKVIKDRQTAASRLSAVLEKDEASISAALSLDRFWVPIEEKVETKKKEEIENLKIEGVDFEQQYERFYPEASMAATLLGFVGRDNLGGSKGYFGIEGYYDRLLRGKEGSAIRINDATGKPILARVNNASEVTDGSDLTLTIDRAIQFLAEREIKKGVERFGATSGMIGIINPKTGEILALATYPSYDPRTYSESTSDLFVNHFISSLYEPGSTFKPLIMSSALNENKVTPSTRCPICDKPVSVGGYQLHTWNDKYFKNTTMTEVIQHSDNIGMVFVAKKLGLDKMLDYLNRFGIGKLTGIDLQGETAPYIKPKQDWYEVDHATVAFGQGISVTPIELLTSFSSIANGGKMMQPRLVKTIVNPDGGVVRIEPKELGRPISSTTAKVMTEMLVNAVEKGEASYARLKGYRIAGKTGTASIPVEGHYDPSKTIASFQGFAPADDPKFAMLVIFNKPTAAIYGAETAAPVFFSVAADILNYYGIAPTVKSLEEPKE